VQNAAQYHDAEAIGVFVTSMVAAKVIEQLPKLKFIAALSTGYDNINLSACQSRGITVSNVPTYGENTVAEYTMALILALSRRIVDNVERTRKGNFSLEGLRGFDLKGRTIGIIGGGHIGMNVVRIAKGFGMNVLVSDVHQDAALAQREGFSYAADLDSLLSSSDIITLHAPYIPQTHHMININNVDRIKRGALLINTARGALVETDAILYGLREGILSGVGLDVLEEENALHEEEQMICSMIPQECNLRTLIEDHVLLTHPKVIVTSHNAFNTTEALKRILDTTVENIKAFFAGKPINFVEQK
jgi:D-lactate dehydrogenase